MTARELKDALRRRHPGGFSGGMIGEWVTTEEWLGIDLLAMSAWSKAHRVGYEVKVSRSDYRRELLRPHKRANAVAHCSEFYFAVPAGLLTAEELAYEESLWDDGDFARVKCPARCVKATGGYASTAEDRRYRVTRGTVARDAVPVPVVVTLVDYLGRPLPSTPDALQEWERQAAEQRGQTPEEYLAEERRRRIESALQRQGWCSRLCPECGGKGYIKGSRVEREAPTLWVPNDVGLIEVTRRGCRVTRKAPRQNPRPLVQTDKQLHQLLRHVSARPDPRHHQPLEEAVAA